MPWFKVDDNFADHQKVRQIPRGQRCAAVGLWALAGSWCARHLKDGLLPDHMIGELSGKHAVAKALVTVDLWHTHGHGCGDCPPVPQGHYLFHEWASCQPTKAEVEAERAAARERQRKARDKAKSLRESQRDGGGTSATVTVLPTRPDPTRPVEEDFRGNRNETLTARTVTEPTCQRHPLGDGGTACGGCAKVREWGDRNETRAERDAERRRTAALLAESAATRAAAVPRPKETTQK